MVALLRANQLAAVDFLDRAVAGGVRYPLRPSVGAVRYVVTEH